ncbi:MAG: hypothetical protein ACODAD_03455 [Planctomycetota bacterium]
MSTQGDGNASDHRRGLIGGLAVQDISRAQFRRQTRLPGIPPRVAGACSRASMGEAAKRMEASQLKGAAASRRVFK